MTGCLYYYSCSRRYSKRRFHEWELVQEQLNNHPFEPQALSLNSLCTSGILSEQIEA